MKIEKTLVIDGHHLSREMEYYDFSELLESLGIVAKDDFMFNEEDRKKAETAILALDLEQTKRIQEWLKEFASMTFMEDDALLAEAISKMKDQRQILHYFSILFTNFWW